MQTALCTERPLYQSRGGLMVSMQVRQSEGLGFKPRSGQIAYFHGAKTRLSTLGTGNSNSWFGLHVEQCL